jgi:hypothetical protein
VKSPDLHRRANGDEGLFGSKYFDVLDHGSQGLGDCQDIVVMQKP